MTDHSNSKTSQNQQEPFPSPTGQKPSSLRYFHQALHLQAAGDKAGALKAYDLAIADDPSLTDAHFNRGILLKELGRYEEALKAYDQVLSLNPHFFEAHYNKGNIFQALQRYDESLACFDAALSVSSSYAPAHNNRGAALKALGRYEEALAAYDRVLVLKPGYAAAYNNRGFILAKMGRYEEALESFDRVIAVSPALSDAHNNRGVILKALGRWEEALAAFDLALAFNPGLAEIHNNRGGILKELDRYDEALSACDQAIVLSPDFADAHINRGNVLQALGRFEEAIEAYDLASRINPYGVEAFYNRGIALQNLERYEEALAAFDRVIAMKADSAEAYNNRGVTLQDMGRYEEALAAFDRAILILPDSAVIQSNKSILLLLRGEYEEGWRLYEWRLRKKEYKRPGKLWLGETDIKGKTILLYHEQGLGDTLQMLRYIPLLAQKGASVFLEVPASMLELVRNLPGVLGAWAQGENLPEFDLQCPFMSLPLAFQTTLATIPAAVPYLQAPENKVKFWKDRLGNKTCPRIGLVWSGTPSHKRDARRSIPLPVLSPLFKGKVEFHSLQIEYRDEDREILRENSRIADHSEEIADFGDTAALIEQMDLIISVDTSAAHLACAMGKPVWMMLPYSPDFRWLTNREDSPWYPTARLFRQPSPGNWDAVVAKIASDESFLGQTQAMDVPAAKPSIDQILKDAQKLQQSGAFKEALAVYDRAVSLYPDNALLCYNRGNLYRELNQWDEALADWNRAVEISPNFAEALTNIGIVLMKSGKLEDALDMQNRAIGVSPALAAAHANRGMVLNEMGRKDEALEALDRAAALDPYQEQARFNRGIILMKLERYDKALAAFDATLALDPTLVDAHYNRAFVLHRQKRYEEALSSYNRVLSLDPQHVLSHWNKSLLLLLLGNYEEGWPLYEWRFRLPTRKPSIHRFSGPLWLGQTDLAGKTLFLYREQGYGDTIQMLRYVPLLTKQGAQVIVSVNDSLFPLVAEIPDIRVVVEKKDSLPEFDLHCPLMSLPLAFKTTLNSIPSTVPYLKVPEFKKELWKSRLEKKKAARIGLVWSGVAAYGYDRERSIPLKMLLPLLTRDAEFHSLQIEYRQEDKEILQNETLIRDHSDKMKDFGDTAALISEMDLVISVDTSVVHLAGALGKPVWILLPYVPDFRWLLDREDSPWYPTARLFRQPAFDAWPIVIERLLMEPLPELARENPE